MAVTAAMVKKLREQTGAGMMDCKKALSAVDGDMDKAVEFLREKGLAAAAKKAGRIAAEGLTKTLVEGSKGVIVEVNSETDFVAKNAKFQAYVADVAKQALDSSAETMEAFMAEKWEKDPQYTVEQELSEQISVIGEKLSIRRFERLEAKDGLVVDYVHGGGRISVLVEADSTADNEAVREALKNVAMQIAALHPQYITRGEVPADYMEHEREILMAQIQNDPKESQKPEKVIKGIIEGRISKEMKDICLMDQVYVRAEDGKQSVAKYLQQVSKEAGTPINVTRFVRYETGEGLQKRDDDFAAEVAKQMQ